MGQNTNSKPVRRGGDLLRRVQCQAKVASELVLAGGDAGEELGWLLHYLAADVEALTEACPDLRTQVKALEERRARLRRFSRLIARLPEERRVAMLEKLEGHVG